MVLDTTDVVQRSLLRTNDAAVYGYRRSASSIVINGSRCLVEKTMCSRSCECVPGMYSFAPSGQACVCIVVHSRSSDEASLDREWLQPGAPLGRKHRKE